MEKYKRAFTLVEILITIGLLAILGLMLILLLNPLLQIGKAKDVKRKNDLAVMKKAFEEYYNDKGCYPEPEQVCFDSIKRACKVPGGCTALLSKNCHICGSASGSPANLLPYLSSLPCDPDHPKLDYLYEVEASCKDKISSLTGICCQNLATCSGVSGEKKCASWFKIYSTMSVESDSDVANLGCNLGGCGLSTATVPTPPYGYSYGVTSPNIDIERANSYYCFQGGSCQSCNTAGAASPYDGCMQSVGCQDRPKYSSDQACRNANGL